MQLARTRPRIDWQTERERIDLAEVAINLLGPAKKREGRRLLWLCPFHDDHNPSFSVDPARKRWDCRPCGIGGDAAALVMRYERKTFPEALAYLTGGPTPTRKAPTSPAPKPKPKPPPDPSGLPEADALALVEDSAARLWTPEGADPLAYLTGPRFLTPETIRAARLGWTPRAELPTKDGRTWRASGVVIPYFTGPRLARWSRSANRTTGNQSTSKPSVTRPASCATPDPRRFDPAAPS